MAAQECMPLANAQSIAKNEGLGVLWAGDEIVIDEAAGQQTRKTAGQEMTVREHFEAKFKIVKTAKATAARAVQKGLVEPGKEDEFISTVKEMTYLELKQYGAAVAWVGLLANIDAKKAIVLRRSYEFLDAGRGEVRGSDSTCVQARLDDVAMWPAARAVTAAALIQGPERVNCSAAGGTDFPCASLSQQLALAQQAGEVPYVSGRVGGGVMLYTINPSKGTGRALLVFQNGTTLLTDRVIGAQVTLNRP
jgi:hypothetical protein